MTKTFVVAGNGPSLREISPGVVLAADNIIRTNSFFFEHEFHLGQRVDIAYVAGDPRVAPFVFATLKKAQHLYDIRGWATRTACVRAKGAKYLTLPCVTDQLGGGDFAAGLSKIINKNQALPTAGLQAAILAQSQGAERIILAGIDLYAQDERYAFAPGQHMRDLLGADINHRSYDERLHSQDVDLAVLDLIAEKGDTTITCATPASPLARYLDVAPTRQGDRPKCPTKPEIDDWVDWAGCYPIVALKFLRRMRYIQRRGVLAMREFCGS